MSDTLQPQQIVNLFSFDVDNIEKKRLLRLYTSRFNDTIEHFDQATRMVIELRAEKDYELISLLEPYLKLPDTVDKLRYLRKNPQMSYYRDRISRLITKAVKIQKILDYLNKEEHLILSNHTHQNALTYQKIINNLPVGLDAIDIDTLDLIIYIHQVSPNNQMSMQILKMLKDLSSQ